MDLSILIPVGILGVLLVGFFVATGGKGINHAVGWTTAAQRFPGRTECAGEWHHLQSIRQSVFMYLAYVVSVGLDDESIYLKMAGAKDIQIPWRDVSHAAIERQGLHNCIVLTLSNGSALKLSGIVESKIPEHLRKLGMQEKLAPGLRQGG